VETAAGPGVRHHARPQPAPMSAGRRVTVGLRAIKVLGDSNLTRPTVRPDLAHLVCTGPADRLESYTEVVGYGFGSGEGVVAGLDFDGAVAAGGLDELAD
jgi:hypothetical protein